MTHMTHMTHMTQMQVIFIDYTGGGMRWKDKI